MNIKDSFKSLGITESEALDSWEDELATTPEDEVSTFYFVQYHTVFTQRGGCFCSI